MLFQSDLSRFQARDEDTLPVNGEVDTTGLMDGLREVRFRDEKHKIHKYQTRRNQPDVVDTVSHCFQSARVSTHGSSGDRTTLESLAQTKRTWCETTRRTTPKDDV